MNSRIYTGKVMHVRHSPILHKWVFPFYFYAIDLDELPELDRTVKGFGYNHWRPVSIRNCDYLCGNGLAEFVDTTEASRIILITVARFMAKVFNPVSFYFGLRADGTAAFVVAEVNNTFGERHLYHLKTGGAFPLKCRHEKQFHVSPFNDMNGHYEFIFSAPEKDLSIDIKLIRDDQVILDAAMWGSGVDLTTFNLWKVVLSHPITAALTMPRIIWQAIILRYKKKLPVFKHPKPQNPNTIKVKK